MRALGAAALALCAAAPLHAQRLTVDAQAWLVEHRLLYQSAELKQTGTWLGARASLSHRSLRFEIGTHAGSLGGSADPSHPDRDVRTTLIAARVAVRPWLELGMAAEARRASSPAGASTWRTFGMTARAATDLGLRALRGFGELTMYPAASGTEIVAPTSASRGIIGIQFGAPQSRVSGELAYRFERYNVSDPSSSPRHEHFEAVVFGVGVLLRR